jgi:plastocyanin
MKRIFMLLCVLVLGFSAPSQAAVDTVEAAGVAFSPSSLTISVGDTVVWIWINDSHTVTSGTGAVDPQAGVLWNEFLDVANQSFEREFPTDGVFPFFCIPHEGFGMTGSITVQAPPPPCVCSNHADPNPDGVTNVLDVVKTVNVGFRGAPPVFDDDCPFERTDANCSGFTNVLDVVKMVNVAFRGADPAVQFCVPCN